MMIKIISRTSIRVKDRLSFIICDYVIVLDRNRSSVSVWDFSSIKYFNSLDSNHKFPFENLEARLSIVPIDYFITALRNTLFEYGFKEVVQLEI